MIPGWQVFCQTVARRGDHPALVMGDLTLSFAALGLLTREVAGGLLTRGVRPDDRVVLHLANGPVAACLPAALWALGAVPVLAPSDLQMQALEGVAERVAARAVISDTMTTCSAAALWPAEELRGPPIVGDRAAAGTGSIVFTSGSTGRPKGVVQLQATLTDGARRVALAVGFGPADRLLTAVPWSHDYGWTQLLALYCLGLTVVLPTVPGLAGIPQAIERHRPTVLGGVPSVYAGLSRGISDIARRDRSSVRLVMSTGSLMPDRIWADLAALFSGARRCLNYGLTETFRSATLRAADEGLAPAVVGSALPGSGLCVVDETGQPVPAGQWGEVVHRGAGVFERYWDDPAQTALRRRTDPVTGAGPAVFTGDRGMLDDLGRLTLGDRIDRMVKVMGLAASPLAIEQVLRSVPGVEAAAVVTRPHEIMGAELHAVLVLQDPAILAAAQRAVKDRLAPHERPRRFHLKSALPLTASGKVDLVSLTQDISG